MEYRASRSLKMPLGCNPLGTLHINMKNLKARATGQLRQIAKHCERVMFPSVSLLATITHNYIGTSFRQQIIYATCPMYYMYFFNLAAISQRYASWLLSGSSNRAWSHLHRNKVNSGFRSLNCSLWSITACRLHNLLPCRNSTSSQFKRPRETTLSSDLLPEPLMIN